MVSKLERVARVLLLKPALAYAAGYRAALREPFDYLRGQLFAFFGLSLYVKLVEIRLASEYAPPWIGSGNLCRNLLHTALFCGQELLVFAAVLVAVVVWQRADPPPRRLSHALARGLGLVVLPLLSIVEVLGLSQFAHFLRPLGPDEIRVIAFARHIITASNVLHEPEVAAGLVIALALYFAAPAALWLPRRARAGDRDRARLAALVAAGVLLTLAPKPLVSDALLEPHPVLWLVTGYRPTSLWQDREGIAATDKPALGRARFKVTKRPTNVILFVLESTRAESVALYDPRAGAGRQLLRYADEAVVFEHVYAPVPTSAHAIFSLLYGVYPYLGPFWTSEGKSVVAGSLAQVFGHAGYATHFYVTSDLDYDNVRSFAATGFDRVLDVNDWPGQEAYALLPWGRDDRLLLEEAKRFITARGAKPFFLFAMSSNPHHPYALDHLGEASAEVEPQAAYERLVDYDLGLVAELYEWLKARGMAERTLLLVIGDHGEAFGEHAGNFGHAAFIYRENVHVPCFILHPKRLGLPRRIAQLGSQVDVRRTILDIVGLADPQEGDGMSLLSEDPGRAVANFTENGVSRFGMRDTRFTYLYTPHTGGELLFDERTDPAQTHNLAVQEGRTTALYRDRLRDWDARHQLSLASVLR